LVEKARYPKKVPAINLRSLKLISEPRWPLETHLGVRYAQQRNELWEIAHFSTDPAPNVVEVLLAGGRPGGKGRPGVTLHQVEVRSPLAVGAALMKARLRPHGVIAHGILAGRSLSEIEFFFRSVYINTDPLAELVVDVPDPRGKGLLSSTPTHIDHPRPGRVHEVATRAGWDHIVTERLSPGRSGLFFRKRLLTDTELIPVVTDLIANTQRLRAIDEHFSSVEGRLEREGALEPPTVRATEEHRRALDAERKRADEAERALTRLRNRRSVRLALALSRPTRGLFRMVRSWKRSR
jgi:hypothetical protein